VTPGCNVAGSCKNINVDELFQIMIPSNKKNNVEQEYRIYRPGNTNSSHHQLA
jgi:hypothetical protein